MVRASGRWLFWGLVGGALIGLVGLLWLDRYLDESIRCHVEGYLQEMYPHLEVSVRSARLVEGEGIIIRGVSLRLPSVAGPAAQLLYCDEIHVECDTSLQELLTGQPDIRRFTLDRPRVRLVRQPNGHCQLDQLWPRDRQQQRLSLFGKVQNGTLEWIDRQTQAVCALRDINLQVERWLPAEETNEASSRSAEEAAPLSDVHAPRLPWEQGGALAGRPKGVLPARTPSWRPMRIYGTFRGDHLESGTLEVHCDPDSGAIAWNGTVTGLELSPELRRWLPQVCDGYGARLLAQIRCRARLQLHGRYDPQCAAPWDYLAVLELQRGRADDPRLPYSLSDIRGTIRLDPQGVTVQSLSARSGPSALELSGRWQGLGPDAPWTMMLRGEQVLLDRRVFEALPRDWQITWNRFLPEGLVNVEGELAFDGRHFRPNVKVRVLRGSFAYEHFPYRVERAYGDLVWTPESLRVDLTAFARTDPLKLMGEFYEPGPHVRGWFSVTGNGIRLDQDLVAALPESARNVVAALHVSGAFDLQARFWREKEDEWFHHQVAVGVRQASLTYDHFPYPLHNIRGTIGIRDGAWTFEDLLASNDSAQVRCHGRLVLSAQGGGERLELRLIGQNIPLAEELRQALDASTQALWDQLQPRGRVDLDVGLEYDVQSGALDVTVNAAPRGDTCSLEPRHFPWKVEKLRGAVHYHNGRAELREMAGVHGETVAAWSGFAEAGADGGWQLHLEELVVDHLSIDRDLLSAVPAQLRECLTTLNPTGKFNLQGAVHLHQSAEPRAGLAVSWDTQLILRRNAIQAGVLLENLYGSVQLRGQYRDGKVRAHGALRLDSVTWEGFQFTEVQGPLVIDNESVLLGVPHSHRLEPDKQPHISASLYGGMIYGDAWVVHGNPGKFSLRTTVRGLDLSRLAMEQAPGRQNYAGKLYGVLELSGTCEGRRTLTGGGSAVLRNANIYELPQMIALLKVLRFQPPDGAAFTTADCDFHIQADHIYFDKLNFNGDAISLLGKGEMNFDKQVRLAFRARAGREDASGAFPLLNQLIRTASSQFVMVNVTGTLENPEIHSEPLPAVSGALQELQEAAPGPMLAPGGQRPAGRPPATATRPSGAASRPKLLP